MEELQIYIDGKYYPNQRLKSPFTTMAFFMETAFSKESVPTTALSLNSKSILIDCTVQHTLITLQIPLTKQEMTQAVVETLRKNKMKDSYIRLVVSRGVGDLGLDPRKCPKPSVIIITDIISHKSGQR